jgi:integrase
LHNLMTKLGVTRPALGVTPHGLRHGYAGDRYEAVTGVAAPVRGGMAPDPATDEHARLQVAEELGHARLQIASAYLGSRRVRSARSSSEPRIEGERREPADADPGEVDVRLASPDLRGRGDTPQT